MEKKILSERDFKRYEIALEDLVLALEQTIKEVEYFEELKEEYGGEYELSEEQGERLNPLGERMSECIWYMKMVGLI